MSPHRGRRFPALFRDQPSSLLVTGGERETNRVIGTGTETIGRPEVVLQSPGGRGSAPWINESRPKQIVESQ